MSTRDKTQIMDTVSSVVRAGAVTAVIIEHDMDVVFRYSDRIVMMHEAGFSPRARRMRSRRTATSPTSCSAFRCRPENRTSRCCSSSTP